MDDLTGKRLGSCVILRHLRSGGMGDIYLANQPDLGRQVAVKVIRPDLGATFVGASTISFIQEARAVAALEHPHILPIYDFGDYEGLPYLVMQYVPTGSLADVVAERATPGFVLPLTPALAAEIIGQAAAALQYAHDHGVMHLDVKPQNMLLRLLPDPNGATNIPRPHVLLADFGLARAVTLTQPGTPISGTPLYAAPEQFQNAPVPASDQYALAGVAFQLLTGAPLFGGSIMELLHQHQTTPPPRATALNPQLPVAIDAVLARALAKSPDQRYPRVQDFAQQLQNAAQGATSKGDERVAAAPPPPIRPPRPPVHRPEQSPILFHQPASPSETAADNAATVGFIAPPPSAPPARVAAPWSPPTPSATPPAKSAPKKSAVNPVLLGIGVALIVVALIIAGFLFLPDLFTTTVVIKKVPSTNVCATVSKFTNAGVATAGAQFTDVPFPAGALSYLDGASSVNGHTVQIVHACSPGLTVDGAHAFFATAMPSKGWSVSNAFPANSDGACGDAYCWMRGTRYVGLDTPSNGTGYVMFDLRLVR